MELIELIHEEDGGATIILDVTEAEKEYLISYAIKDILMKAASMEINSED